MRSRPEIEDVPTWRATGRHVARVPATLGGGGSHRLLAERLCGVGVRLMAGLRLRVEDVGFDRRAVIVREGKGFEDRAVMRPAARSCA